MNWNQLSSLEQLATIDLESQTQPILILKHSTRCSISAAALNRLERNWAGGDEEKIKPYYLDLIKHRDVSNEIEKHYSIRHESPQVLIIRQGKCIYSVTHFEITYDGIMSAA